MIRYLIIESMKNVGNNEIEGEYFFFDRNMRKWRVDRIRIDKMRIYGKRRIKKFGYECIKLD